MTIPELGCRKHAALYTPKPFHSPISIAERLDDPHGAPACHIQTYFEVLLGIFERPLKNSGARTLCWRAPGRGQGRAGTANNFHRPILKPL
jgi:hypothetical protein